MKKVFTIVLFLASVKVTTAQTAFFDAIRLSKLLDNNKHFIATSPESDSLAKILSRYYGSGASSTAWFTVEAHNPFLYKYFSQSQTYAEFPIGTNNKTVNIAAIPGIDVTNVANGIAGLLIDRAKQELTIAFFDRFKKFATDPAHPEFITLFPQTTDKLDSLLSYNYPQMLPQLRSAFFADLKQAPYNIEALLELSKYQNFLAKFPEILIVIKSLRTVRDLEDGTSNAADVIKSFASDTSFHWTDPTRSTVYRNTGTVLNLASILSESLRKDAVKNMDSIWVSGKQIKSLVTDNTLTTIYMGLIYQQIRNQNLMYYTASRTDTIAAVFAKQKNNILLFQNKIAQFISVAAEVNTAITGIHAKKDKGTLTKDDYYNYINVSLDAINYAFSIAQLIDTNFNKNDVLSIPRKANSLYKDIYSKQYTQAVSDGLDLLTQIKVVVRASPDYKASKDDDLSKLLDFAEKVKPYAVFMGNVVEATSADDVKAALDNVVLPVGSYTIKQTACFNISVNGYLGYAFDFNSFGFSDVYAKGIYAPIGFSFSTNIAKTVPVSLFIGVIDVGSVVSYQLANSNVPTTSSSGTTSTANTSTLSQQIKLGSIFSPSAQVFFEIPKFPLAIGAGWRRTPTLYYSGGAQYSTVGAKSVFNLTALIDIPLFTLFNHPYNKGSAK